MEKREWEERVREASNTKQAVEVIHTYVLPLILLPII